MPRDVAFSLGDAHVKRGCPLSTLDECTKEER